MDEPLSREEYYRAMFPNVLNQCGRFKADDPYERCGILLWERKTLTFREVTNHHDDPTHHFRILSKDVQDVRDRHPESHMWGYLHTHPRVSGGTAVPSGHDRLSAKDIGLLHCVYHPGSGSLTIYNFTGPYMRLQRRPRGLL